MRLQGALGVATKACDRKLALPQEPKDNGDAPPAFPASAGCSGHHHSHAAALKAL